MTEWMFMILALFTFSLFTVNSLSILFPDIKKKDLWRAFGWAMAAVGAFMVAWRFGSA